MGVRVSVHPQACRVFSASKWTRGPSAISLSFDTEYALTSLRRAIASSIQLRDDLPIKPNIVHAVEDSNNVQYSVSTCQFHTRTSALTIYARYLEVRALLMALNHSFLIRSHLRHMDSRITHPQSFPLTRTTANGIYSPFQIEYLLNMLRSFSVREFFHLISSANDCSVADPLLRVYLDLP